MPFLHRWKEKIYKGKYFFNLNWNLFKPCSFGYGKLIAAEVLNKCRLCLKIKLGEL